MIGDWVDAESLQPILLGATVVLVVGAALVWRGVRRLLLRLVLVALIGALAASLWLQRADLQDCVDTCSCRLFGQEVDVPADVNPNCG
ncbi:MAG: hypothetical protein F4Z00_06885 [Acidimicrobiaceae bacterium]|nr:hypothetical protein [Acidimicrobiaceae bacterium]MCY3642460.1 hypothetical protein [Acidimicrobiaceae bacterium]MDE0493178.1 hypothetical protein [Acidimicrobiaceae bacterium]MDE0665496.1 hypothetical protein [Acidimicrobiaceae bacterium]MXY11212.1 hypothetical protein [Acidimicrobiaceae bacterium]